MSYQVEYAGVKLHDYLTILNIKRTVLPPRTNFTKNIPSIHGEYYMGYKYAPRKITLECLLRASDKMEFVDNLKDLAFILDVKAPSRLVISDSPDRFCYAVIDGDIEVDKVKNNGKINLEFICYDPITYSEQRDSFLKEQDSKKLTLSNAGTTDTYPEVQVSFNKTAHFFSCANEEKVVLIGIPPNADNTDGAFDPVVLKDSCETLEGWNPAGNVLDSGRVVDGNLQINGGGYGIMCNQFGSNNEKVWHGGAMRKNLSSTVSDFKVEIKMEHNSKGDLNYTGAGANPPSTSGGGGGGGGAVNYKIVATPSLRIRSGRGTNYKQIGSIPNHKVVSVTDIQKGWGYTTYNGVSGYICMEYTQIYNGSSSSSSGNGTYKIVASPSLRIRSGRGTNYKQIGSIPNHKQVSVTDIQSGWGKTTYNGKTGYISMQYTTKISSSRTMRNSTEEKITAENKLGRIEVYGFDRNGVKLFKATLRDSDKYYEYTQPEIEIGSNVVLDDNKTCPAPRTETTTDDNGKTTTKEVGSGRYGDWNEFVGWFTIQRKTNQNGQQEWFCKVEKIGSDNKTERIIQTQTLVNNIYPKGDLANIVIWFGQYSNDPVVEVMNINEVYVTNIGTPPKPKENKPIFKQGDELLIDFNTQKVYKGARLFMNELDIGSQFFSIPVGSSEMRFVSDDETADVEVFLRKRWI